MKLSRKKRIEAFRQLRRDGIFHKNQRMLCSDKDSTLLRERKGKTNSNDLRMCGNCKALIDKANFWKHTKKCPERDADKIDNNTIKPAMIITTHGNISKSFEDLLSRFLHNEKGNICHSDPMVQKVGEFLWEETNTSCIDNRKNVMYQMTVLAGILPQLRKQTGKNELTGDEIFHPSHWDSLRASIFTLTNADSRENLLANTQLKIGYVLKQAATVMKCHFMSLGDKAKMESCCQ